MIPNLLVCLPFILAIAIFFCGPHRRMARWLLIACGGVHTALVAAAFILRHQANLDATWFTLSFADPIQTTILAVTSIGFLAVSLHTSVWLPWTFAIETQRDDAKFMRETTFLACMAAFLGSMSMVILANNFGLLWVAIEATTLFSAPLICFHLNAESIEAMWKYLLLCSVGIGFALFGTMLMAYSAQLGGTAEATLNFQVLSEHAKSFDPIWFKAAFVFIVAGYGTKMGLAPFHTWLPDAHSESPAIVSALLSGSLLNCAFLAITRFRAIAPATLEPFCDQLMIGLGVFSIAVAAIFIIRQHDYKRMLGYSSLENMGLIIILFALGSRFLTAHIFFHSLIKMSLFVIAGNILLGYGTRDIGGVRGLLAHKPVTAVLWIVGILLIAGMPPSPLFFTELSLIAQSSHLLGGTLLTLLFIVFCGLTRLMINMVMGPKPELAPEPRRLPGRLSVLPAFGLAIALITGLFFCFLSFDFTS